MPKPTPVYPANRRPATCHPDRVNFGRGLCSSCYFKARRAARDEAAGVLAPATAFLEAAALVPPRDLADAVAQAQAELQAALPEAVRALRKAIVEGDPDKGFSIKAAVAVLQGVSVPGAAGLRRLLEAPEAKPAGPAQAQIVIGLQIAAGDVHVGRVVGTLGPAKGD
jgi:hypothetical protein